MPAVFDEVSHVLDEPDSQDDDRRHRRHPQRTRDRTHGERPTTHAVRPLAEELIMTKISKLAFAATIRAAEGAKPHPNG